jgi:hypothetical protein
LPDWPVQEACQADKLADNLAQVVAVLVLAADPVAVVDPAAAGKEAAADKEAVRVLAVDPVEVAVAVPALGVDPAEVAAAVAVAEAVFH